MELAPSAETDDRRAELIQTINEGTSCLNCEYPSARERKTRDNQRRVAALVELVALERDSLQADKPWWLRHLKPARAGWIQLSDERFYPFTVSDDRPYPFTFISADFSNVDLSGATFPNSTFMLSDFTGAHLAHISFKCAQLPDATFSRADLTGAEIRDTNLMQSDFEGAVLNQASITGSNVRSANLLGATVRDAEITHTDLSGATLRSADLRGTDFTGAILLGANFSDANLKGAVVENAWCLDTIWNGAICPNGRIATPDEPCECKVLSDDVELLHFGMWKCMVPAQESSPRD